MRLEKKHQIETNVCSGDAIETFASSWVMEELQDGCLNVVMTIYNTRNYYKDLKSSKKTK